MRIRVIKGLDQKLYTDIPGAAPFDPGFPAYYPGQAIILVETIPFVEAVRKYGDEELFDGPNVLYSSGDYSDNDLCIWAAAPEATSNNAKQEATT